MNDPLYNRFGMAAHGRMDNDKAMLISVLKAVAYPIALMAVTFCIRVLIVFIAAVCVWRATVDPVWVSMYAAILSIAGRHG